MAARRHGFGDTGKHQINDRGRAFPGGAADTGNAADQISLGKTHHLESFQDYGGKPDGAKPGQGKGFAPPGRHPDAA